jgi:hypothetical protein
MSTVTSTFSISRRSRVTSALARFSVVGLLLSTVAGCSDSQKRIGLETPAPATVKGRVFLITRGGDLKPARLADVYLFSVRTVLDFASTKRYRDDAEKWCNNANESRQIGPETVTRVDLAFYKEQIEGLEKTFSDGIGRAGSSKTAFAGNADEDGRFIFAGVPSGEYTLVVFGQAGVNLAYWQAGLTVTNGGEQPEVKLSAPVTTCAML